MAPFAVTELKNDCIGIGMVAHLYTILFDDSDRMIEDQGLPIHEYVANMHKVRDWVLRGGMQHAAVNRVAVGPQRNNAEVGSSLQHGLASTLELLNNCCSQLEQLLLNS